jgi:DNA mismatch repair protein MutH
MTLQKYDKTSVESIYKYSRQLSGKTLAQVVQLPADVVNQRNRGDLGRLIEIHFYDHNPPNDHRPDFAEAGLELKTTGTLDYKKIQKSGEIIRAKERMTLTNINFLTIENEEWETSTLLAKCNLMLILFYKYDKSVSVVEQYFNLDPLLTLMYQSRMNQVPNEIEFIKRTAFQISEADLEQIRRDWEFIRQKIKDKRAHELSEGDTFYLGACRKGSGKDDEALKKQAGSDVGAKSRAFSFKQNFLSKLVQGHSKREVALGIGKELTFEEAIENRFAPFIGMTVNEISEELNYFSKAKSEKWLLAKRILARDGQSVQEFEKAEIQLKTVSLSKSGGCREDMSFPAFKYDELVTQDWEDSDFSYQVETKFLFVVFKADLNGNDRLEKVMYWNMPYEDRLEARRVWEDTKIRVGINARDLPKRKDSKVAHVRPHATNKKDVDRTPQGEWLVKRCFWLNGSYIAKVVS